MGRQAVCLAAAMSFAAVNCASAQSFTNTYFFGASFVDSGRYLYMPRFVGNPGSQAPAGAGAWTTNPGQVWSSVLAEKFGLSATPSAAPGGGTNYAAGGARIAINDPANNAWSVTDQVNAYLANVGGRADSNALYVVALPLGDLLTTSVPNIIGNNAALTALAEQTADLVKAIHQAGGKYFVVPNLPTPVGDPTSASRQLFVDTLYGSLAAAGINFVPADTNGLQNFILDDALRFGFTNTVDFACGATVAYLCTPADYVVPDADQTYFWADPIHLTSAAHGIIADYVYGLLVAPSQISFLPENAVKARSTTVAGIQQQIGISLQTRGPSGVNIWANGDISRLQMDNFRGFPGDPSTPVSGTIGMDFGSAGSFIAGAAVTLGYQKPSYDLGGSFTQKEVAASVYAAGKSGSIWADVIATYGWLSYDVNRVVPLGITQESLHGDTSGSSISFAARIGYDFQAGAFMHGPFAGIVWQRVDVDGFTEAGGFSALSFGDQRRYSTISGLGYRWAYEAGVYRPFGEIVWNHEWCSTGRGVTAALTSISAPGYTLPGVQFGDDWAQVTLGLKARAGEGLTVYASISGQVGQTGVTGYGARIGLNAFY